MPFPVATRSFYDRSSSTMTALTAQTRRLMEQNATGKKLLAPSDDSAAYGRLQVLKRAGANEAAYGDNIKIAQATLQQADTQLDEIKTQLQQVTERTLAAANGTLNASDRKSIATDLKNILATIVSAVNVRDARGQPLFGGTDGAPAASIADPATGTVTFATGRQTAIPIGDDQTVEPSVAAGDMLKITDGRDIGEVLTALIATLDAGLPPADADQADLATLSEQVISAQASVGARGARVDLQAGYFTQAGELREEARSGLEDNDFTATTIELQKTLTVLEATQQSFGKLSQLSLFDYIR